MANIVSKKEKNLLIKSEITKEYPELFEFLNTMNFSTNEEQIIPESLSSLLGSSLLSQIFDIAKKEWSIDTDITPNPIVIENHKSKSYKCEYCETEHLKYLFYIKNSINKNVLVVGSTCINELGIADSKGTSELLELTQRTKRLTRLNSKFYNIALLVKNRNEFTESIPYILPKNIKEPLENLTIQLDSLYYSYLSMKTPEDELLEIETKIQSILEEILLLKDTIIKYISDNENNPLIAEKSYINDLKTSINGKSALEEVERTGYIGKLSITSMKNKRFLQKIMPKIKQIMTDMQVTLQRQYKQGYVYTLPKRNINYYIRFEELVDLIGESIFNEPLEQELCHLDFLLKSNLDTPLDMEKAIYRISKRTGYVFEVNEEYNEIFFYQDGSKETYYMPLAKFYNQFKKKLLMEQNFETQDLLWCISNSTYDELNEYLESRK